MGTAQAGKNTKVSLCGAPVGMVDEPMGAVAPSTYWVGSSAKRIIDPRAGVVVKDDGVTVAEADYTVDHLMGMVYLDSAPTTPVTITADYLPTYELGSARALNYVRTRAELDATPFNTEAVQRILGLADVSGSIEQFEFTDQTIGAGESTFIELIENAEATVIEIRPDGSPSVIHRAWVLFNQDEMSTSPDAIVEITLNFVGDQQLGSDRVFSTRN